MPTDDLQETRRRRRRKIVTAVSLVFLLLLTAVLTALFWKFFASSNETDFRVYVASFGVLAPLIFLGAQMLQIFLPSSPVS